MSLVFRSITEENFWRNYFYRVSLIIQAAELGTLGADGVGQASSGEDGKLVIASADRRRQLWKIYTYNAKRCRTNRLPRSPNTHTRYSRALYLSIYLSIYNYNVYLYL